MSDKRWTYAILEREWLACITLAYAGLVGLRADKMPALTQQMIAIWVLIFVRVQIHVIEICNILQLNTILFGMLQIKFIFLFFNAMNCSITAVWMALIIA